MAQAVFDIKIGGDYGCFSRPEFKVERVTYPLITPSAARGLIEAIFWKPEIRWEIREIHLLKPIRQMAILRNELSDRQGTAPFFAEEKRQQRASLVLKDVAYVLRAEIVLRAHAADPVAKYADQFRRRLERGQCHHTPCLGVREFPAWFEPAAPSEMPENLNLDIGSMLFDIAFCENANRPELTFHRKGANGRRVVKGFAEALFFNARVERGVLRVPRELYKQMYQMEGDNA